MVSKNGLDIEEQSEPRKYYVKRKEIAIEVKHILSREKRKIVEEIAGTRVFNIKPAKMWDTWLVFV